MQEQSMQRQTSVTPMKQQLIYARTIYATTIMKTAM